MVGQKVATLRLYKRILTLAKRYPSIKRDAIVQDIRADFRENKNLVDPKKIQDAHVSAQQGLEQLQMYANLDKKQANWSVDYAKGDPFLGGK